MYEENYVTYRLPSGRIIHEPKEELKAEQRKIAKSIAKYANGVSTKVVTGEPEPSTIGYIVGSKIIFETFDFNNFNFEIWEDDNGVKKSIGQDPQLDNLEIIVEVPNGVLWVEEDIFDNQKMWFYDGTTITEVAQPAGFFVQNFITQIGNTKFYYKGTGRKFYKVVDNVATLISENIHFRPRRIKMVGQTIYYDAEQISPRDSKVYSISCTTDCEDDLTISTISQPEYGANNSIASTATVSSGTSVLFSAGMEVLLNPQFEVMNMGAQLAIIIQSCSDFQSN